MSDLAAAAPRWQVIQRRMRVPSGVSAEAAAYLEAPPPTSAVDEPPMWSHRAEIDAQFAMIADIQRQRWPVDVTDARVGLVPIQIVTPTGVPLRSERHVLMNLHGGGWVLGGGSLAEAIPVAGLTGLKVAVPDYRLAPEHPFPAAVEDAAQCYRWLLERHAPEDIVVFGSSAGAGLSLQLISHLQEQGLPLPAAIGAFSPPTDLSDLGDSGNLFSLNGLWGDVHIPVDDPNSEIKAYVGNLDLTDPRVSPLYADLRGYPPVLLLSGSRDLLLSNTIRMHLALLEAGVSVEIAIFEAMPHCHWIVPNMPESRRALDMMSDFFLRKLKLQ